MTPTTPDTEYAFWNAPEGFTITYSLGVFHEIDYQVNEGYRRIPHGGIEVGGLLFGRSDAKSTSIEAFRPIDCEHASGPSFILSERDLANLHEQISASASDPELNGLDVLGWFVAHTRAPLQMNDREVVLFDELFPENGKLMLLVKPERFQPTRFGFLVRGADGRMPRDASQQAVILPLPGRGIRPDHGPVASIPAPAETAGLGARPSQTEKTREHTGPAHPIQSPARYAPHSTGPGTTPTTVPENYAPEPFIRHRDTPVPVRRSDFEPGMDLVPYSRPLPSIEEIRRRRSEYFDGLDAPLQLTGEVQRQNVRANLRLTLVLFLSAAIGCGVGYWGYLQLPPATIPMYVQDQPSGLLVSWPPDQTRDCVFAALRIDDEQEAPLSLLQRAAGQATISPSRENVKIELIAQHWMRDSRGIIRYVKPLPLVQAQPVEELNVPAVRRPPAAPADQEH